MQVTLRKADRLAHAALDRAATIAIPINLVVSIYDDTPVHDLVDRQRALMRKALDTQLALKGAHQTIRQKIGADNETNGVNGLLREKAALTQRENALVAIVGERDDFETEDENFAKIESQLRAMRDRAKVPVQTRYGNSAVEETLTVQILSAADRKAWRDDVKKIRLRKSAISEELTEINMQRKIRLPDDIVALLREHQIIE